MAENWNENDVSRESCIDIIARIQGYLERKKGVLGGKSKQWCSLQGSTLYLQKKQSDVMETIDLKDAHLVRKVSSEYTGTHFEICMKKKNHVFICSSSKECLEWVKALQAAMIRKDLSQNCLSTVDNTLFTDDKNPYNEVDETLISVSTRRNPQASKTQSNINIKLSDYTEPCDNNSGAGKKENDYWEVEELRNNLCKSKSSGADFDNSKNQNATACPSTAVTESANKISTEPIYMDAASEIAGRTASSRESYNYSQIQKGNKTSSFQDNNETVVKTAATKNDISSSEAVCMRVVSSLGTAIGSNIQIDNDAYTGVKSNELECVPPNNLANDEDVNLFQILTNSLTDRSSPIRDYIHPLTEEDRKPIDDLTDFLRNNLEICSVSYSCVPVSSDPVSSLKSYLETLDMTLRQQ